MVNQNNVGISANRCLMSRSAGVTGEFHCTQMTMTDLSVKSIRDTRVSNDNFFYNLTYAIFAVWMSIAIAMLPCEGLVEIHTCHRDYSH